MLYKIYKKSCIKVTPYCAVQAAKGIVSRGCYLWKWIELLGAEITCCKTVGMSASFYFCCLWGLRAHSKTVIIISILSPNTSHREV